MSSAVPMLVGDPEVAPVAKAGSGAVLGRSGTALAVAQPEVGKFSGRQEILKIDLQCGQVDRRGGEQLPHIPSAVCVQVGCGRTAAWQSSGNSTERFLRSPGTAVAGSSTSLPFSLLDDGGLCVGKSCSDSVMVFDIDPGVDHRDGSAWRRHAWDRAGHVPANFVVVVGEHQLDPVKINRQEFGELANLQPLPDIQGAAPGVPQPAKDILGQAAAMFMDSSCKDRHEPQVVLAPNALGRSEHNLDLDVAGVLAGGEQLHGCSEELLVGLRVADDGRCSEQDLGLERQPIEDIGHLPGDQAAGVLLDESPQGDAGSLREIQADIAGGDQGGCGNLRKPFFKVLDEAKSGFQVGMGHEPTTSSLGQDHAPFLHGLTLAGTPDQPRSRTQSRLGRSACPQWQQP